MIISVSAVVDTALRLFTITVGSGLLTLMLILAFGAGSTCSDTSTVKWCAVFGTLAMIISWLVYGHPGVEFIA